MLDHSVRRCIGRGRRMLGGETWGAAGAGTMHSTTGAGSTQGATGAGATKDTTGADAMYSTTALAGAGAAQVAVGATCAITVSGAVKAAVDTYSVTGAGAAQVPAGATYPIRRCTGSGRRMLRHWSCCCTKTSRSNVFDHCIRYHELKVIPAATTGRRANVAVLTEVQGDDDLYSQTKPVHIRRLDKNSLRQFTQSKSDDLDPCIFPY